MARTGRKPPTHVDDRVALGQRLRAARRAKGLSLRQLAWDGCSPAYLSRIESGLRVPSPDILAELARRLEIGVEQLAGRPIGNRLPEREQLDIEMRVRLNDASADSAARAALASAERLGDQKAQSRMAEALGQLRIDHRDDEAAVTFLEQARSLAGSPTARARPSLYESLGRAYAGIGDLSRAISVLRASFDEARAEPVDPSLMLRFGVFLASALTDLGQPGEALVVLSAIVRHEDDITDPLSRVRLEWALSRTYAEAGSYEIAERYARRVIAHYETSEEIARLGRANLVLGAILLDEDRVVEAKDSLLRAAPLMEQAAAPERALLSYELSRAALADGDLDACLSHAQAAISETERTEPGTAGMAYVLLAKVALAHGELTDADFIVRKAIELLEGTTAAPYRADALETLADVEERSGNETGALTALRQAAAIRRQATLAPRGPRA